MAMTPEEKAQRKAGRLIRAQELNRFVAYGMKEAPLEHIKFMAFHIFPDMVSPEIAEFTDRELEIFRRVIFQTNEVQLRGLNAVRWLEKKWQESKKETTTEDQNA